MSNSSRRVGIGIALIAAAACGFVVAVLVRTSPEPVAIPNPSLTLPTPTPTAETVARMKAAAVFFEIEHANGVLTTGSGWFGVEPNWIVTNAHVLGMLTPGSPPPAKLTAFAHPGVTGRQLELPHAKLRVVAVDRDMDVALVEVLNPPVPLPAPLPLRPSATLTELEKLVVLGFPGGRRLAEKSRRTDPPMVSVAATTVGGLRRDSFDNLFAVQVQGGILHGSSGGPLCDGEGNCVGVAVRVDLDHHGRLTGIGYGVPAEYVAGLVAGRAGWVSAGQGYVEDDAVAVPVTVHCHDPRKKLTAVGVVAWVGDATAAPRPPGTTRPPPAPADADESEVPLPYDPKTQTAFADVALPPLPAGRAYWVQPWYTNALVPKQYLAAVKLDAGGPPVTRRATELAVKYPLDGKRPVQLKRVIDLTDADGGESSGLPAAVKYVTDFAATERVAKPTKAEAKTAFIRTFTLDTFAPYRERNGYPDAVPAPLFDLIRKGLPGVRGTGSQSAFGDLSRATLESKVPELAPFATPLLNGLQSTSIPLPNKTLAPLAAWHNVRDVRWSIPTDGFDTGPPVAPTVADTTLRETVTYTYLGLRDRAARTEAVVSIAGVVAPVAGAAVAVSGSVWGEATVDVETGEVMTATLKRSFDLGFGAGGSKRRWSGNEELFLRRGVAE